ncbi:MAG: chorismate-binding protein [Deltaproteobacteria bacterium]|nr:chorismate-binding protein [Deltaproteobacteria bacterium]
MIATECNKRELPWKEPAEILLRWPAMTPLLFLGGGGRFSFLATSFWQLSTREFLAQPYTLLLSAPSGEDPSQPCPCGYWGLLSFDDFSPFSSGAGCKPSLIFRVSQALVFDHMHKKVWLSAFRDCPLRMPPMAPAFHILPDEIEEMFQSSASQLRHGRYQTLTPIPRCLDAHYLDMVSSVLEEIRCGRYYQINLLRYFDLAESPRRDSLISLICQRGGPYSALWDTQTFCLASLSPECFIRLQPEAGRIQVITCPIKGTIQRSADSAEDKALRSQLRQSQKDQAELHMIVDLMRNDLNSISRPGSVRVLSPGKLRSFPTVHHLIADIRSQLSDGLSIGEIFHKLCPAGSITGVPKREVMEAIRAYEGCHRGYFMGNLFRLGDQGSLDSSVLIRTLWGERSGDFTPCRFSWAAGSGLTLGSIPECELEEIRIKTRVLEESFRSYWLSDQGDENAPAFHSNF